MWRLIRRTAVPTVLVNLNFDAGFAADAQDTPGTQSLMLNLLDQGTQTRDATAIARRQSATHHHREDHRGRRPDAVVGVLFELTSGVQHVGERGARRELVGQLRVIQAFLPALRRRQGRIVLMGSIAGRSSLPFLGAYAMSKFGMSMVTLGFAERYRELQLQYHRETPTGELLAHMEADVKAAVARTTGDYALIGRIPTSQYPAAVAVAEQLAPIVARRTEALR